MAKTKWVEYNSWAAEKDDQDDNGFDYRMEAKVTKGSMGSMIDPPEPDDVDIASILVRPLGAQPGDAWAPLTSDEFESRFGEAELDHAINQLNMAAYEQPEDGGDFIDDEIGGF